MQRARETCDLARLGDKSVVDFDLAEWDYVEYEELTTKQSARPIALLGGCPGGETPE